MSPSVRTVNALSTSSMDTKLVSLRSEDSDGAGSIVWDLIRWELPGLFSTNEVNKLFPFYVALSLNNEEMFMYFWNEQKKL